MDWEGFGLNVSPCTQGTFQQYDPMVRSEPFPGTRYKLLNVGQTFWQTFPNLLTVLCRNSVPFLIWHYKKLFQWSSLNRKRTTSHRDLTSHCEKKSWCFLKSTHSSGSNSRAFNELEIWQTKLYFWLFWFDFRGWGFNLYFIISLWIL